MRGHDQEVDERTVSALLTGVEMAAEMATSLPEPETVEIAARITEQAQRLTQLMGSADSTQQAEALQAASGRAFRAAERVCHRAGLPHTTTGGAVARADEKSHHGAAQHLDA